MGMTEMGMKFGGNGSEKDNKWESEADRKKESRTNRGYVFRTHDK